ncbi:DNA ligase [compost metagenome]
MVPRFAVMLATSFSEKALAKIKYPAFAQLKADGSRTQALVDIDKGVVSFWTRNGKEVFLSKGVADQMLSIFPSDWTGSWVVDGEIVSINESGVVDRATGNGIYNKAIKGSISPEEESKLNFQVWDLIPYDEWQAGKSKEGYKQRLALLNLLKHDKFTTVIETHVVNNLQEAEAIYTTYIEQDLEGIILKNFDGPWEDARSKNQVKFKQVMTADLEILEVMPGKEGKKYADIAGTLRCTTSCRQLFVDASGMSDDERKWFWENRHTIGGSIAEIEYNGIVKRRGATIYSLFLPQFVVLRPDKTVANSLDELQTKKSIASVK